MSLTDEIMADIEYARGELYTAPACSVSPRTVVWLADRLQFLESELNDLRKDSASELSLKVAETCEEYSVRESASGLDLSHICQVTTVDDDMRNWIVRTYEAPSLTAALRKAVEGEFVHEEINPHEPPEQSSGLPCPDPIELGDKSGG